MAPETPKGVSSRLLTMKFMQRAAASASSSGSPDTQPPSSKKRKLDHSPAAARINANIDQAMIKAALDDQEAKRQAALANHATGDTHWVLSNTLGNANATKQSKATRRIVYVGYGDMDSSDETEEDAEAVNSRATAASRRTFGVKKSTEKAKPSNDSEDSSNESSSDEDENDDDRKRKSRESEPGRTRSQSRQASQSRSRSHSKQSRESSAAKEFREKRKKKEVRLNKLTSISSHGGDSISGVQKSPTGRPKMCYNCHQSGHIAADCPKKNVRGR